MINFKKIVAGLSLVTASLLYGVSTDGTYTNAYGTITNGGNVMSDSTYTNYGVLSQIPNRVVASDGTYTNYAKLEILNGGEIQATPTIPTTTPTTPTTPTVPTTTPTTPVDTPTTQPEIPVVEKPVIEVPVIVVPESTPEIPVVEVPDIVEPEKPTVVEPEKPEVKEPTPEIPVEKPTAVIEEILDIKEVIHESIIETKKDEDITKKDTGVILDEDARKEQFSVKEDAEIIINENGGSEVKTELIKENGETVETKATVNTNGTVEASLKTDAEGDGVVLKSANTDTQVEVKDDGSVEMIFDLKDEGEFGETRTASDLNTDKAITGSSIKALASDNPDAVAGATIELKVVDAEGNEESVETKTVSKVKNSSVVITDEGTVQTEGQSEVSVKDENGDDKAVAVKALVESDKFGKTNSELTITDEQGKETVVSFGSEVAGTITDMKEDGSLETKATLGDTEVLSQMSADGKTTSSVTIQVVDETTGESKAVELKTSSDLEGANTTLAKDGSVETKVATKVEAIDTDGVTQEINIELSVKGDTKGEATHTIVARDTDGEVMFETKATSEIKGAETKITQSGSLETKASITNDNGEATQLKIETDINGNTTHTVSTTDAEGNEVVSNAKSEIQGASTVIKEDGLVETKATPKVFAIEGKTIEAIVDTLPNGEAYTRFEVTDIATGEVTTQDTTQEGSSFESGNKAIIKEENGLLKLNVETKVTRAIEF